SRLDRHRQRLDRRLRFVRRRVSSAFDSEAMRILAYDGNQSRKGIGADHLAQAARMPSGTSEPRGVTKFGAAEQGRLPSNRSGEELRITARPAQPVDHQLGQSVTQPRTRL